MFKKKQRQNKRAFVLRFVTHIAQALSAGRPVPPVIFQDFVRHRRLDGVLRQTGNKGLVRRFDGIVAVVDCNQHIRFLLYFNFGFSLSLHESVCVFTTGIRMSGKISTKKGEAETSPFRFTMIAFAGKDTPRYNRQALCKPDSTDRYHTGNPYRRAAAKDYYTHSAHDDWWQNPYQKPF